ncbi:MAG: hypothetical protein LUG44_07500 [Clostridiales bacterium]|nr:hypothetical protein [Clostridiales bacterium]
MLTLLSLGAKEPEQAFFTRPADSPDTPPFPVPATDCPTAEPSGLTETTWSGEAADPFGLT